LGVSHHTVSTQRENLESTGQIAQLDKTVGADGKERPRQVERKPVSVFNPTKREEKALTNPKVVEQVAISGSVMAAQKEIERAERQELIKEQIEKPKTSAHIDIFTTDKKYRVVYADPPWQYNDKQDTSKLGGAEKKYPTMPLKDICSLPVPTESNAVLFLWVTSPMLEDAFQVIHAWGFSYKSSFIWDKVAHNMGHYNSVRHEFLLICTKGSCTPDVPKLLDSVVSIERTEHSVKPKEFRDMIDMLYPVGERLEMFAREAYPGWDVWGNMA
jgi:N6-adenosine-specific RNA methylase IME4